MSAAVWHAGWGFALLRIVLVNMPFASWSRPSFALSQMSSHLRREFGDRVHVRLHNLNLDFAELFGADVYESISDQLEHLHTGLGEWLFRHVAFPQAHDNTEDYLRRFYQAGRWDTFREKVFGRRGEIAAFCQRLIDEHRLADADVVGFTSMFAQNVPSLAMARLIKERDPSILTAMGGANCESPMGNVIAQHVPALDFIFSGPALVSFSAFLQRVMAGETESADDIPGVLSRRNYNHPRRSKTIGRDLDINDFIPPDYASFRQALQAHPELHRTGNGEVTLFFETSRGCWWGERSHCTFCGLNGQSMNYRSMTPQIAIDQFNSLFQEASWCSTFFCTDNVMPRHYPREVFDRLTPPEGASIYYEIKLPVSRRDLQRMASAGVTIVQPGIEALATSTLKLMGKGTTVFQNLQFLKHCREFGIAPDWNLLIGFPGEDPAVYDKYLKDIPLLTHLPPPHGVYLIRFDRFSPYFNRRDEYQLDLEPMDYYGLIYPFPAEDLHQLAYFFADRALSPYAVNALDSHAGLRRVVSQWRDAWQQRGEELHLLLREDPQAGWTVSDARVSPRAEFEIAEASARLLQRLSSPVALAQLVKEWPDGEADLSTRVAWLRERSLLFEEDGRLFSLTVTDEPIEEPAPATGASSQRKLLTLLPSEPGRATPLD